MADQIRVTVDVAAVAELAGDPGVRAYMEQLGGQVAEAARSTAPRRTGAGAASIHAETDLGPSGWETRIGWDQLHAYMRFPDLGTRYMPADHFLEQALDRYVQP